MKLANAPDRTASSAEFKRLAELVDRHAACLWSMSLFFFEDPDAAEDVVADLLVETAAAQYPIATADFRREASRRMYLESRRLKARAGLPPNTAQPVAGDITGSVADVLREALNEKHRTAFALCWLGEHTYRESAELLSLPAPDVLDALRLGLQALDKWDIQSGAATHSSHA